MEELLGRKMRSRYLSLRNRQKILQSKHARVTLVLQRTKTLGGYILLSEGSKSNLISEANFEAMFDHRLYISARSPLFNQVSASSLALLNVQHLPA